MENELYPCLPRQAFASDLTMRILLAPCCAWPRGEILLSIGGPAAIGQQTSDAEGRQAMAWEVLG